MKQTKLPASDLTNIPQTHSNILSKVIQYLESDLQNGIVSERKSKCFPLRLPGLPHVTSVSHAHEALRSPHTHTHNFLFFFHVHVCDVALKVCHPSSLCLSNIDTLQHPPRLTSFPPPKHPACPSWNVTNSGDIPAHFSLSLSLPPPRLTLTYNSPYKVYKAICNFSL